MFCHWSKAFLIALLDTAASQNDESGTNDGFSLSFRDSESSFEALFRNIDLLQSRVQKLIYRVEKVASGKPGNASSINRFSQLVPLHGLVSTAQNPAPPKGGKGLQVGSLCVAPHPTSSENNMGSRLVLESAVSSHEEVTPCSNTIGNTDRLQVGNFFGHTEVEVLIDNEHAKGELHDFEKLRGQLAEKPQVSEEKQPEIASVPVSKAVTTPKVVVKSNMKTRYGGTRTPATR